MAALRASAGGRAAWLLMQRATTVLLCATFAGCAVSTSSPTPSVPTAYEFTLVSETLKDEFAWDPMFWVDNDRLMFRADVYEGRTRVEGKRYGLYLWDERTRTVRQIEPVAAGLCATDAIVSFLATRGDQLVYVEGPLDALRETPIPSGERGPKRVRCRAVPPESLPGNLYPLTGGGFLLGRRFAPGGAQPYLYLLPGDRGRPDRAPHEPSAHGARRASLLRVHPFAHIQIHRVRQGFEVDACDAGFHRWQDARLRDPRRAVASWRNGAATYRQGLATRDCTKRRVLDARRRV